MAATVTNHIPAPTEIRLVSGDVFAATFAVTAPGGGAFVASGYTGTFACSLADGTNQVTSGTVTLANGTAALAMTPAQTAVLNGRYFFSIKAVSVSSTLTLVQGTIIAI